MPPWSTAWNSAHQALGTLTIQRGSTLPSALTLGKPGQDRWRGTRLNPKEAAGQGWERGAEGNRPPW